MALAIFWIVSSLALVAADPGPGPRQFGCTFTYNNRFHILGGQGLNNNYNAFAYTEFPMDLSQGTPEWHALSTNATFFSPSYNGSASYLQPFLKPCVVSPNGILVVGGNDFIGYDIANDRWLGPLNISGSYPPQAFQPCIDWGTCWDRVVLADDSLWIFQPFIQDALAGTAIYILNMTTFTWITKQQQLPIPNRLHYTTLYYISPKYVELAPNGVILMMNGIANIVAPPYSQDNQTIWMFDMQSYRWSLSPTMLAVGVDHASAFYYPPTSNLYLIPGGSNATSSNAMEVLNITTNGITAANFSVQALQPSARSGMCGAQQGSTVILYGGNNGTGAGGNDNKFYIFDMASAQWTLKASTTTASLPAAATAATASTAIPGASSTSPSSANTSAGSSPNLPAIIGGVAGGVLVLLIPCFIVYRRRASAKRFEARNSNHFLTQSLQESTTTRPNSRNSLLTQLPRKTSYRLRLPFSALKRILLAEVLNENEDLSKKPDEDDKQWATTFDPYSEHTSHKPHEFAHKPDDPGPRPIKPDERVHSKEKRNR